MENEMETPSYCVSDITAARLSVMITTGFCVAADDRLKNVRRISSPRAGTVYDL